MGAAAARLADRVYLTSDNPRGEVPAAILAEISAGAQASGGAAALRVIEDRREAIRAAVGEAAAEDVVLIAGKGHEDTQTVGERVLPFSDREEARRALAEARCTA
jgi:UDP-N-acetylmuramoyl-L-alanyl-D-glutamate--2,6-diaminopimelate ligase